MTLSTPILDHWTPRVKHSVAELGKLQEMDRTCSQKLALWRPDEALWTSTNGPSNMNANKTDRPMPSNARPLGIEPFLAFTYHHSEILVHIQNIWKRHILVGTDVTHRCESV